MVLVTWPPVGRVSPPVWDMELWGMLEPLELPPWPPTMAAVAVPMKRVAMEKRILRMFQRLFVVNEGGLRC